MFSFSGNNLTPLDFSSPELFTGEERDRKSSLDDMSYSNKYEKMPYKCFLQRGTATWNCFLKRDEISGSDSVLRVTLEIL